MSIDAFLYANGGDGPNGFTLFAGSEIQIPLCESHRIAAGNTLSGIAGLCDVTLDQLVTTNIRTLAPFGSLDAVPLGVTLAIPQNATDPAAVECDAQPAREQVIEYLPKEGEGIFCLSTKFGVSTTSIIQANTARLTGELAYGEEMLLIPPVDGAIYQVTAEDLATGVTLLDLAEWYEISPAAITDWNLNPVSGPLMTGQQLFLPGALLAFGPFQSE